MKATEPTKTDNGYSLTFMSSGICSGCEACRQSYNMGAAELTLAVESGEIADEPSFSWQPCELCGSTLGGDRYSAHGRDANNEIVHLDICVDCLMSL